tara:strand:- start:483 stop:623 length:141 start_codon:yes stop_codon:yes gene_type:complete
MNLLKRIFKRKVKCKHEKGKVVYADYQDRFYMIDCYDCGKTFFEDM